MNTCLSDKSRPWEYIPTGVVQTTCDTPLYVSFGTKQDSLQNQQRMVQRAQQSTLVGLTVAATIANSTSITSTIKGQLLSTSVTAAQQYQPPEIICVPAEVRAFLRDTQNAGVSVMPFRFQDCKGNTSVSFPS